MIMASATKKAKHARNFQESWLNDREFKEWLIKDIAIDNKITMRCLICTETKIEEIIGERKSGKSLEYLVRWKGFGPAEDSWEPVKGLSNAKQAIKDFHQKTQQLGQLKKGSRKTSRSRSRSTSRSRTSRRSTSKSPARSKRSTSRSRAKASTVTTLTSTPIATTAKKETVLESPSRYERKTETITTSTSRPAETQQYSSVSRISEYRSSDRPVEVPSATRPSLWESYVVAPCRSVKDCCQGVVRSDYPALVVFAMCSIIVLSFLLEKHVNFEDLWKSIVQFVQGVWVWLTQLVPMKK